eukprot:TRINITY_DN14975_c0_g1_i2.p1 TRINITY_DN14975_c0_g1~~TRINITY_DN14975_c0_g1_i2.p1  ORF type:complete len:157 (-),score=1.11 TRINITY_DN14975_c0_g1_i2:371-841(-)
MGSTCISRPKSVDSRLRAFATYTPSLFKWMVRSCSSCSVLSTGTETWTITEHVNQLLEPIRRRNEECAGYLERRSLDGTWVCNLHASEAPAAVARWARVLHINGRRVVLGDGEDAVLQMVDGHIMLDKGRLVRVGSKLLRFGRTSKLVYELLYANT